MKQQHQQQQQQKQDHQSSTEENSQQTNKRKPEQISPPQNQPASKMANLNSTLARQDKTVTHDDHSSTYQTSSTPSDQSKDSLALCIDETNTTKDLHYDSTDTGSTSDSENDGTSDSDHGSDIDKEDDAGQDMDVSDSGQKIEKPPAVYKVQLPTTEDMIALQAWAGKEIGSSLTKEERIAAKGKYAKALMNSPPNPETYTKEREKIHCEQEKEKTLYGSYHITGEGEAAVDSEQLLEMILTRVNRKHIAACYKSGFQKFVLVLRNAELKNLYTHEINFRREIEGREYTFKILPRLHRRRAEDKKFITLFFPTTISNTTVERAFMAFGKVYFVRQGTFKKFEDIHNGKHHILLAPNPGTTIPHTIEFEGDNRKFEVFWGEKEVNCRKCSLVHMLQTPCDQVKRGAGVEKNVAADPRPVDVHTVATLSQPQNHSPEGDQRSGNGADGSETLGPKPNESGPDASLTRPHNPSAGDDLLNHKRLLQLETPVQVNSEKKDSIDVDSETVGADPSDHYDYIYHNRGVPNKLC